MAESEKYNSPFEGGQVDEAVEYALAMRQADFMADVSGKLPGKLDKTNSGETKLSDSSSRFIVCDGSGNVIATIDASGVNSNAFVVKDNSGNVIGAFDGSMIAAIANLRKNFLTREQGLRICDANGNVAAEIDENGVFDVKAIGSNLSSLIAMTGDDTDAFPSYLEEEYEKTLHDVQALQDGENTFSFGFMTDLHFCNENTTYDAATKRNLRSGVKNAMAALRKFSKDYALATVVMNGDYQQHPSPNTKQMGIDTLMDVNRWMAGMDAPKFALCGNHEHSYSGGNVDSSANFGLSRNEIYSYLSKKYVHGEVKKAGERVYYQIDDADGVVFVYITTTGACATLGTTITSTSNIESDLKTAYDVVIAANTGNKPFILISHYCIDVNNNVSPVSASVNGNVGKTIDYFKGNNRTVIAFIGGHCHSDWVKVYTGSDNRQTVVISCLQSGLWTSIPSQDETTYAHAVKTATESAFSIFTVNKDTGKIYCTRFGLGIDREINYNGTNQQTIGQVTYSD